MPAVPAPELPPRAKPDPKLVVEDLPEPERPPQVVDHVPAAKPQAQPPDDEAAKKAAQRQWLASARRFAESHHGRLVESLPLTGGDAALPSDALGPQVQAADCFVGAGRLIFDGRTYAFGEGFETMQPVSRQPIPRLAADLGFRSVYVEIQPRPEGLALAVRGEPAPSADRSAPMRTELETIRRQLDLIGAQLAIVSGRTATDEDKVGALGKLADWTGSADRPPREILRAVQDRLIVMKRRDEQLRAEIQRQEAEARGLHDAAIADLRRRCREISAVVYRIPSRTPAPPASVSGESFELAATATIERRAALRLPAGAIARIRPLVVGVSGRPLPSWFAKTFVVGCLIKEIDGEGNVRLIRLHDIADQPSAELFQGTAKAAVRFRFVLPPDDLGSTAEKEVAVSRWFAIAPVERGRQYRVRLGLGPEVVGKLRSERGG